MRKLASIQKIADIRPMNADRLVEAKVLGWSVVVGKGEFEVGETVAFFEPDAMLPEGDSRYDKFQQRGQKSMLLEDGTEVKGHVLRTMKLRGVYSQGLVMSLNDILPEDFSDPRSQKYALTVGQDITDIAGVFKYEPPLPMTGGAQVGRFDDRLAPKSDALRIQSLAEHYETLRNLPVEATVKVDGQSRTLFMVNGEFHINSRNWEISLDDSAFAWSQSAGIVDAMQDGMAVQFEWAGPGIQKNRLRLPQNRGFVFAVYQDGIKLARSEWPSTMLRWSTPGLNTDEWGLLETLDATVARTTSLRGSVTSDVLDEGVVYHILGDVPESLWHVLDRNRNFKVINPAYLTKHGE